MKVNSDPFGRRLREIREQKGLSLRDLAGRCEVSRTTISNYERGIHPLTIDSFYMMIDALGVSKTEFMKEIRI